MDMHMAFLHDGFPVRQLHTKTVELKLRPQVTLPTKQDTTAEVVSLVKRLNIAGFPFLSSQYDSEVQGTSVLKPLQGKGQVNADTAVVRPVFSSYRGFACSSALYPAYGDISVYAMVAAAIDTAIRNLVVTGADINQIALLDNFCWTQSDTPQRLWQLKEATRACYDYAVAFGAPFISGKDSMFNDFAGFDKKGSPLTISIPPTVLISAIGIVDDTRKAISLDAKMPGDLVYVLGKTAVELGGSEYVAMQSSKSIPKGIVPTVDAKKNRLLYMSLGKAINGGLVASAQSVHKGGLAMALSKIAIAGQLGINIAIPAEYKKMNSRVWLFSESQGRVVVTIAPQNKKRFEQLLGHTDYSCVGTVSTAQKITIQDATARSIVAVSTDALTRAYQSTFRGY